MSEIKSDIVMVQPVPFMASFSWSVGLLMEKFIKALAEKKFLAAKCPACGYAYTPPRNRCGKCAAKIGENDLVALSGRGVLTGYTIAHVKLDGAGNFLDLESPQIIGAIKLEGADSTLFLPLSGLEAKDLKVGQPLKIQWQEQPKGEIADIVGFQPA